MLDNPKVFISGMGALTSTGLNLTDTWSAILEGKSSLNRISGFNLKGWPNALGGEITDYNEVKMLPDKKLKKVISKQDNYGINAAMQAISHSRLMEFKDTLNDDMQAIFAETCGVFVGSPGNKYLQQYDFLPLMAKTNCDMQKFAEQLFNEVHPMWLLKILPNNVLAYVGITYGLKGANHNITNHAVGGTQAIIEAYHAIKSGQISRAVVVGYDLGIEPQALYYYDKIGVLSNNALKPFSSEHDGTILAEGAAAIVIESESSAQERGAKCYAEIIGGGSSTESTSLFSIEEEGNELAKLLSNTLSKYDISPENIDFIVAHGNGNQKSDLSEARAINSIFSNKIATTSFKWSMGHTLCASGILDTILAVQSLKNKCIPGIANLTRPAKGCENLNISNKTRALEDNTSAKSMIINRGFAGMNAAVIIEACK
ncbi:MAG: 3-oxoacyl-ACP synthase [Legionellales bacterium RIFCSPHIGHO2_12_FULL_35_11]|nr:MAG: 3-oxoacyl-ACP synthase [Legionellales bacterium RIFCSPHIGHO2_12_FULL_35_11]